MVELTYLEHGPTRLAGGNAWGQSPGVLRLLLVKDGVVGLQHEDLAVQVPAGGCAVIMGTGPVTYVCQGRVKVVVCDVPAEAALAALPAPVPFIVAGADAALPSAFSAYLLELMRQDVGRLARGSRAVVAQVTWALAADTITSVVLAGCTGWEQRRLRSAVLRLIATRYTDKGLSSAMIAEELSISRRTLQRLFEGESLTVTQHIHAVRTQQAIARLTDPALERARLEEIATLSGFASTVAMRRAVGEATGMSPTDLRQHAATTR